MKRTDHDFVLLVANLLKDGECSIHMGDCDNGDLDDCDSFDMTNDDAVETLNNLIATARAQLLS